MSRNKNKEYFYVVFVGRETGVYDSWDECKERVHGFKGAIYKGYEDRRVAVNELSKFERGGHIEGSCDIKNGKPMKGVCSDAAYSIKTNILEYRVVDIGNGGELIYNKFEGFEDKHLTNVGEFFGLVRAIDYVVSRGLDLIVYCDSVTAITWVKNRRVNTEIKDKKIGEMLMKGILYLNRLERVPTVVKWQTDLWGEIPADFGNKKKKSKKNKK